MRQKCLIVARDIKYCGLAGPPTAGCSPLLPGSCVKYVSGEEALATGTGTTSQQHVGGLHALVTRPAA